MDGGGEAPRRAEGGFFAGGGGVCRAACGFFVLLAVVGDDLAVLDFDDAVGVFGDVAVVGNEDDGVAFGVQFAEDFHDFFATVAVKRAGGFVGEDDLSAVHERTGDGDALLLAAGELARFVFGAFAEAEAGEQRFGTFFPCFAVRTGVDGGDGDVFPGFEVGKQVVALEDEADVFASERGAFLRAEVGGVFAVDVILASTGAVEAAEDVHQGGFARPRLADDGDHFPRFDFQVEIVEDGHLPFPALEAAVEVFDADKWFCH